MIHFERSFDYGLIRAILTLPSIYRHITDDGSPAAEDYRPIPSEAIWYVIVRDGSEVLGLWMFHPHNAICWEVHTALLPNAWGERARQAARQMTEWIWAHTPCRRIITNVPETERLALKFALAAGMEEYGRNPKSFLRSGRLLDQILLGISRPEPEAVETAGVLAGSRQDASHGGLSYQATEQAPPQHTTDSSVPRSAGGSFLVEVSGDRSRMDAVRHSA